MNQSDGKDLPAATTNGTSKFTRKETMIEPDAERVWMFSYTGPTAANAYHEITLKHSNARYTTSSDWRNRNPQVLPEGVCSIKFLEPYPSYRHLADAWKLRSGCSSSQLGVGQTVFDFLGSTQVPSRISDRLSLLESDLSTGNAKEGIFVPDSCGIATLDTDMTVAVIADMKGRGLGEKLAGPFVAYHFRFESADSPLRSPPVSNGASDSV